MQNEHKDFDGFDFLWVLRRQAKLILIVVFVITLGALLVTLGTTPLFRAEALILVDPSEQNILESRQQTSNSGITLNSRVDSEVEILRSPATALAVVENGSLIADPEFGPQLGAFSKLLRAVGVNWRSDPSGEELLQSVLNRFIKDRDVRRVGLTYIIAAGVSSEDPGRAADLANTLARTYIQRQVAAKVAGSLAAQDVIQRQIETAQLRVAESEDLLDNFLFDSVDWLPEGENEEIAKVRRELEAIQIRRSRSASLSLQIENALAIQDWEGISSNLQDQALAELARQRDDLERRLGEAVDNNSLQVEVRASLARIDAQLETQVRQSLETLQGDISTLDGRIEASRDQIRSTILGSNLSSATLAEIFTLQQGAELARQQQRALLARLSDLETQASIQVADSRIVSEALPPNSPSYPNTQLLLAMAVLASTGIGIALAFANEFYISGVTSERQMAAIFQAPVVTSIPKGPQDGEYTSLADQIVYQPLSGFSESMRKLRASVDQLLRRSSNPSKEATKSRNGKIILVCSSAPVEGKTTTALSLARTYALSGKSTVLIDADLRNPSLARHLDIAPSNSLLNYLASPDSDNLDVSFYASDPLSKLNVFLGTGRPDVPTDHLVASDQFAAFLRAIQEETEIVVIDSPPLIPVVDARYIAGFADVVLMLTRFAATSQSDVRSASSQLASAVDEGTPIVGVLTFAERSGRSYTHYDYY